MRLSKPSQKDSLERLVRNDASWRQVGVHAVVALSSYSLAYLAGLQTIDMARSYMDYAAGFSLDGGCVLSDKRDVSGVGSLLRGSV